MPINPTLINAMIPIPKWPAVVAESASMAGTKLRLCVTSLLGENNRHAYANVNGSQIMAKSWLDNPYPRKRNDAGSSPYNPSVEICEAIRAPMPAVIQERLIIRSARKRERGKRERRR